MATTRVPIPYFDEIVWPFHLEYAQHCLALPNLFVVDGSLSKDEVQQQAIQVLHGQRSEHGELLRTLIQAGKRSTPHENADAYKRDTFHNFKRREHSTQDISRSARGRRDNDGYQRRDGSQHRDNDGYQRRDNDRSPGQQRDYRRRADERSGQPSAKREHR